MPSIIKYIGTIKQGLSLVVADNGLVPRSLVLANDKGVSLKPCCSGRWSRTNLNLTVQNVRTFVLILVVVEDGLVLLKKGQRIPKATS